jgi:hypothetical protein
VAKHPRPRQRVSQQRRGRPMPDRRTTARHHGRPEPARAEPDCFVTKSGNETSSPLRETSTAPAQPCPRYVVSWAGHQQRDRTRGPGCPRPCAGNGQPSPPPMSPPHVPPAARTRSRPDRPHPSRRAWQSWTLAHQTLGPNQPQRPGRPGRVGGVRPHTVDMCRLPETGLSGRGVTGRPVGAPGTEIAWPPAWFCCPLTWRSQDPPDRTSS